MVNLLDSDVITAHIDYNDNIENMQIWYTGIILACHAREAGSIPAICSSSF